MPLEVRVAFNITAPGDRADLLYVVSDTTSSPGAPPLPDPTFLAARMSKNASDSVFFAHSAVNMTGTDNYIWANFEGYFIPRTMVNMAGGGFYLLPTSLPDTWNLRFLTDGDTVKLLGAIKTHLSSHGNTR